MPRKPARSESVATIGIDIGKNAFHPIGLDTRAAIVLRQKLSRSQVEARLAKCLLVSSVWRRVSAPIISAGGSRPLATMYG